MSLAGTRTASICDVLGMPRHMELLNEYLMEPEKIHKERLQKLEQITSFERTTWQMAKDDLDAEKARLFLMINETPSDSGKAAAAAEVLRQANAELTLAKEKLEAARGRLILQLNEMVDEKQKPLYGSADLRNAKLAVMQDEDQPYQDAAKVVREVEERVSKAKADADERAPKPKYSNEPARNAALELLKRDDIDYDAALRRFRAADQQLATLKGEADDLQQQLANVNSKLWGLRELVKGDSAVLMAVASIDAPKIPTEIRHTFPANPVTIKQEVA